MKPPPVRPKPAPETPGRPRPGGRPPRDGAAPAAGESAAALADYRLLRHLMMSLGPLGVPLPLLDFWRDCGGSQ